MPASRKLFSLSIFTLISSLWKKPKDDLDPPPTPNAADIPLQQLRSSDELYPGGPTQGDDVIHGADIVIVVEAPPPMLDATTNPSTQLGLNRRSPQLPISTSTPALPSSNIPTMNIDSSSNSSSKRIRKMVATVAIFLITFSSLLIVKTPPDINLMNDSLTKSMASVSDVLVLVTFWSGAWLILHCLLCVHPLDHLNDIWVQKYLMLMGVVFMVLSLLFRTLVTSSTLLVLVSWILALLIVVLAFAFLQMVSCYKFSGGMAAKDPGRAVVCGGNLQV